MDYDTYDEATELANYRADMNRKEEDVDWVRWSYIWHNGTDVGYDPYAGFEEYEDED